MSILHVNLFFRHLKLEIASEIPASNDEKIEANNSTVGTRANTYPCTASSRTWRSPADAAQVSWQY